jgi:hypothetical protein
MNLIYEYTINNKEALTQHRLCICCDCLSEFDVDKILNWIDNDTTALCPYCWNDTILAASIYTNLYTDADIYNYFCRDESIRPRRGYKIITHREDDGCELPFDPN